MDSDAAVTTQRTRAARLLAYLVSHYGVRTHADAEAAARRAGHPSSDAAGLVTIRVEGEQMYPAFQFTGDSLRPGWAALIQPLTETGWTGLDISLWFAAPTGWLDAHRPADLLDTDPDAVRLAIINTRAQADGG